MKKISKSLTNPLSEILILSLLNQKPDYGYEIIKILSLKTNGKLIRQAGSIYPLLSKMEKKGWIKSNWDIKAERPRKVYHILKKGKIELNNQMEDWKMIMVIIGELSDFTH